MIEELVIVGLAAWRLALLLATNEPGPWDVLVKLRRLAGVPAVGEVEGFLPTLFSCVLCMSAWTTAGVFALYELAGPLYVLPLAAWGLAVLTDRFIRSY